jgi:aspartyl aminopeptidase
MCTYAALQGFIDSAPQKAIAVLAVFDNEEIGSSSRQGAASSLLRDVLTRLDGALFGTGAAGLECRLASSVLLSADNAHAVHPNHPEYADANNRPVMGGGIVIKYNAEQRYATDAVSAAVFERICAAADVETQSFANRSDIRGGSTLGNIAVSDLPALTVDIGLAQLAMHSAFETASADDLCSLMKASKTFYQSSVTAVHDGEYRVYTEK